MAGEGKRDGLSLCVGLAGEMLAGYSELSIQCSKKQEQTSLNK